MQIKAYRIARQIAVVCALLFAGQIAAQTSTVISPFSATPSAAPKSEPVVFKEDIVLTDVKADKRTRALFANLRRLTGQKILFGHQDDLAYGVGWRCVPKGSDVHSACGDYPAVYGWELGNLEHGQAENLDSVNFHNMQGWIRDGYKRGGVVTLSWHMDNPVTQGSAWDTTGGGARLWLPGGAKHEEYLRMLDGFAKFAKPLHAGGFLKKKAIPLIFRPYHEMSGNWFWWCKGHTAPEDYKALWRFTVQYLRDEKGLHNLLYAWTPAENFNTPEEFLEYYPGDEWVDIIGIDNYGDVKPDSFSTARFVQRMKIVAQTADQKGKIAALSETGYEGILDPTWWTKVLLQNLMADPETRRIAYVLVWRNANKKHHYAPYPGHVSLADFQQFYADPVTAFERDLPKMYKMPKLEKRK